MFQLPDLLTFIGIPMPQCAVKAPRDELMGRGWQDRQRGDLAFMPAQLTNRRGRLDFNCHLTIFARLFHLVTRCGLFGCLWHRPQPDHVVTTARDDLSGVVH